MTSVVIRSIQTIEIFEQTTETNWTFRIDHLKRQVEVHKENRRMATFESLPKTLSIEYLISLTQQFENVRTLA